MCLVPQATDAIQPMAKLKQHRPDITLMDLRLPGTNVTDTLISIQGVFNARIIMRTTSGRF